MEASVNRQTPVPLGDLVEDICVGYVGPMASEYVGSGVPFLRSLNVRPYRIELADLKFISTRFHSEIMKSCLRAGDVVVVRTGKPGTAAVVPEWLGEANCSDLVVIRPGERVDARYLAYYLNSPVGQAQIRARNVGSVQAHFNIKDAQGLPVSFPSVEEQRSISGILGAFDERIELNRQMNQTLEHIAGTLYRSWFVDFDDHDDFVDSELGAIPRGWSVASIYDVADVIYGAPFNSKLFNADGLGLPLIRIRDLQTHAPETFTPEQHPRGTLIGAGDIVVGMDGEFRAHVWRGPPSWLNQRMCQFKPRHGVHTTFILLSIRPLLAHEEGAQSGTTVNHLGKKDIDKFKIVLPPPAVLSRFGSMAEPLHQRVLLNEAESRTLALIRDGLLPKLVSGELRVPDAKAIVEGVA